ncbi:hypothetical protein [Brevundimonas sp.]|uniref:hypothetical protein n=1 Tax=Brevundimonas sp. TaxID=1871086 RepID=UPI003D1428BE
MTKARVVRSFASFGAAFFAFAYCGFVLAGLNGGGAGLVDLWTTLAVAPAHVFLGWTLFAALGLLALIFRGRLVHRLVATGTILVGLPTFWAFVTWLFYVNESQGWWPGFDDEVWRWQVNHVYAEFSAGLVVGFLGVIATTLAVTSANDPA